jgi:diguanylate cyclase (GGDEF)-like protein
MTAVSADVLGMDATSLLCRDASERERLLDMSRRLRPAKRGSIALLAVAALVSIPVYGWAMPVSVLLAAGALGLVQLRIGRMRRPEYALAWVWLFAQLTIVLAIALADGPRVYLLPILVFPMLVGAAVFPRRVVTLGAAITVALMLAAGFGLMPAAVAAMPPILIVPITSLAMIVLLAARTADADQDSRQAVVVDPLTGLPNRAALDARAVELTHHLGGPAAPEVAVILCDIDHFKAINDEHGHAAGDAVLVGVAQRLTEVVGDSGALYRYGGEEFIVLLEGPAASAAPDLAERTRAVVCGDAVAGLTLTMSLGVARSTPQTRDCAALVASADRALYEAKACGRDRVCVADPMDHRAGSIAGTQDEWRVDRRLGPAVDGIAPVVDPGTADLYGPHERRRGRARSWLIYTAAEREHMLDITERETRIGKVGDPLTLAALVGAGPWLGFTLLIPAIASVGVMQLIHLLWVPRVRRPEYLAAGGVVLVLLGSGLAILLAHRQPLFTLPFLTILIFPVAASSPAPTAIAQTLIAGAVMSGVALLMGAHQVLANPSILAFPLALLGAVAMFGYAIGQSTIDHRAVATIDALTGAFTRGALRSRIAGLSDRGELLGEPVALLMADLDHFKAINDEHGHSTGDRVLVEVVERLRAGSRAFDSVYRIGGEEFVILLVGTAERDAVDVAERVRDAIRERPVAGLPVTVSVGVAACAAGAEFDYEQLFADADTALLTAKAHGRDRVLAGPPLQQVVVA